MLTTHKPHAIASSTAFGKLSIEELLTKISIPRIQSADGHCTLRILSPPATTGEAEWYAYSAAWLAFVIVVEAWRTRANAGVAA